MLLEVLEYFYRVDALRYPHNKDELLQGCGKQTRIFKTAPQAGNLNSPWQRRVEYLETHGTYKWAYSPAYNGLPQLKVG